MPWLPYFAKNPFLRICFIFDGRTDDDGRRRTDDETDDQNIINISFIQSKSILTHENESSRHGVAFFYAPSLSKPLFLWFFNFLLPNKIEKVEKNNNKIQPHVQHHLKNILAMPTIDFSAFFRNFFNFVKNLCFHNFQFCQNLMSLYFVVGHTF